MDSAYPKDVNLTVIKGDMVNATFDIVFTAHGKPAEYTYQWYVDGAAVDGANSAVFTMADLGETVSHSVYCEITNKAGTVTTRVATLKVTQYYTPVLNSSYPADVTLGDGNTISATFKVENTTAGSPNSYTYQWYENGVAVAGATSASYTKSNLITKSTYTIYCKVTNAAGTVQSRTATLTINHTILYIKGNECTANGTGGWVGGKYSSDSYSAGVTTKNSDSLYMCTNGSYTSVGWAPNNTINITNYSKIHINIKARSSGVLDCDFHVATAKNWSKYSLRSRLTSGTGTTSIDISSFNSSYYLLIAAWTGNSEIGRHVTFDRVWLT
jgi:hypothetical protein